MKILTTNVYVGPNIYARFPVIRHVLDLGELEEWPTGRLGDAFVEPLLDALVDLAPEVRAMAVWALDEINPTSETVGARPESRS